MKHIKTFELVDYNKPYFYDMDEEYNGPVYLYSDKPLTKGEIGEGKLLYIYNRADASDTSSEYIYQIKLKNPIKKREGNGFFGFNNFDFDKFDDEDSKLLGITKKEKKEKKYSGYFYYNLGDIQVTISEPEDITSFKLVGGFVKYDKDKSTRLNIELSEKTNSWLYNYISGTIILPKLTQDIIDELKEFKSKEPIKIFKGIEEVQIRHTSEDQPPYKRGQIIKSNFSYPTSWTTNILIARRFIDDYPSSPPYVVSMIINPENVLASVKMLPKEYYHTNQREIIVLPGSYEYKIIWD